MRCEAWQYIGVEAEIVIGTGRFLSGVRRGRPGFDLVVGFDPESVSVPVPGLHLLLLLLLLLSL